MLIIVWWGYIVFCICMYICRVCGKSRINGVVLFIKVIRGLRIYIYSEYMLYLLSNVWNHLGTVIHICYGVNCIWRYVEGYVSNTFLFLPNANLKWNNLNNILQFTFTCLGATSGSSPLRPHPVPTPLPVIQWHHVKKSTCKRKISTWTYLRN